MTGTVHFDVPDTDHSPARQMRPSLLRPVSMEEADNSVNEIHESLPHRAAARLYRQLSTGFNSRTIRCILVVSLGLNLIFAVLVGIFVGFWQSTRDFDTIASPRLPMPSQEKSYSCFACPPENTIPGLQIAVRSINGVCCTTDNVPGYEKSNQFRSLTQDYFKAQCPDNSGTSWPSRPDTEPREKPIAAHLTLDVPKSKDNLKLLPAKEHYLSWNVHDDTGVSFISENLRYVNGTITIPSSGRYHIYTHLLFDTNSNSLNTGQSQLVIDHSITRISRGSQVYLLLDRVNIHTREIKSSDLEGTFELREGDLIKVVVSYPSYLYNFPQTNVFGLFKLMNN